jgi:hypothetical protein
MAKAKKPQDPLSPLSGPSVALNSEELGILITPPSMLASIANLPLIRSTSQHDGSEVIVILLEPRVCEALERYPTEKLTELEQRFMGYAKEALDH